MPLGTPLRHLIAISALAGATVAAQAQTLVSDSFESMGYGRVLQSVGGWSNSQFRFFVDYDPTGYTWDRPVYSKYSLHFPALTNPGTTFSSGYWAGKNISYNPATTAYKYMLVESSTYVGDAYTGGASYGTQVTASNGWGTLAAAGIDAETGRVWISGFNNVKRYSTLVSANRGTWHRVSLQVDFASGTVNAALDGWDLGVTAYATTNPGPLTLAPMFVNASSSAPDIYFDDYLVATSKKKILFRSLITP